uniref:Arabinogalactan endo-beta-1,4-galactanase n=1 Tax=Solibacter usitatus (strain Ellin6076) TaxID=234267 RepID=Q01QQ0_SOLUE
MRAFVLCLLVNMAFAQDFRVSLSVSPFTEIVLKSGTTFHDGKATATTVEDVQRLFVKHGANEVYARIATTRKYRTGFGDHSMERGLERARMAAALHLPFNPELGLFNVYGDIRCQPAPDFNDYPSIKLPRPWTSLTLEQMTEALRAYGAAAAREILATGVQVRIWDIGNEIEFGIAGVAVRPMPGSCDDTAGGPNWYQAPDTIDAAIGKMSFQALMQMSEVKRSTWLGEHVWPHEAKMLAAVASGIRSADPKARFSTHVSGIASTQPTLAVAFFKAMREGGFSADELGVSYYPTSSPFPRDRLQSFKDMATAARRELGRPVFVAEFGYPAGPMEGMFPWNSAVAGYPQTPDGQAGFVRDLVAWGAREKTLSGIRPWAPDLGLSTWAPMSLFALGDKVLTPRPALDALRP